jgi:uncharacterized protein YggT (Ycf19 family)
VAPHAKLRAVLALISLALSALQLIVIADVVLSWIMQDPNAFPRNITRQITEPLYAPIHTVLKPEKMGGFDLSPIVILLLIGAIQGMLKSAM